MGTMLRNTLRSVCVSGGWSYAVFWRIVECGDSRHLIWEEGHHEPSRTSSLFKVPGFEAAYSLLEEWGVVQENWDDGANGNKFQLENRVGLLVEKIMKPKVHLVGCGIIGCAALTGNHQWILQNELSTKGYSSQDLEEMKDQFSAGVQTVAVLPVLPYGVIQLGSVQMITQTMGFISHIRSLFWQLGLVTGALFSDSNIRTSLHQKVQSHILPELTVSAEVSDKTGAQISMGSTSNSCNYQVSKAPASSPLNQLHCPSVSEIYEKGATTFADSHMNSKPIFKTIIGSLNEILQPRAPAVVKSTSSLSVKQEGQSGATFGFSNADEIPYQHANFNNSKSEGQSQPSMVSSEFDSTDFIFLKQQLLPSFGPQVSGNSKPTLGGAMTSHTGSQMHPDPHYSSGSTTTSLLSRSESSLHANSIETGNFCLFPNSTGTNNTINIRNLSSSFLTGYGILNNSSFSDNHLSSMEVTSIDTENIDIGVPSASKSDKWKMKNGSSQALAYPSSSSNSCVSRTYSCHESLHESFLQNNNYGHGSQNFQVNDSDQINALITDEGKDINSKDVHIPVHTVSKENSCLSFMHPSGNDLYDALGLDVKPRQSTGKLDALFASTMETNAWDSNIDVYGSRKLDADPVHFGISCSEIFSDLGHDQLLDAVVSKVNANAIQCSDDNVSWKTTLTNISQTTMGNIPSHGCRLDSSGKMLPCASPALGIENAGSLPAGSCSLDKAGDSSQREEAYKSQISLWVENNQSLNNDSTSSSNCKRIDETAKLHRKRPKPGETPRPRPKDRQMIQDRVKELREIVPNGAKCSIDALLERTIKHMLFLQSVTKHADKLKETGAPKIINKGGLLLKDNFEGGATWAFEIGSQSMICPIIVEDLNPPRQLLVEMLCEDRGFFLEIADLIKGLGLTILKGVMEVRNDKVWARFAVEANSDVTRMDIFLSLVRLLEPTAATNVGPPQGFENTNMAHNMPCQSSIPATGVANHVQ